MKTWTCFASLGLAALLAFAFAGCGGGTKDLGAYKKAPPVGANDVFPSDKTVLDETYPLARPLFIYVDKEALKRPEVAAFVKFYLDNAKKLSAEVHYTPAPDAVYQKNQETFAAAVGTLPSAAADSLTGSFTIDGSSTVYPISELVAEEFHAVQKNVKHVLNAPAGTGGGVKKFIEKKIEICDASRELTKDEEAKLQAAGVDWIVFTVAMDGLAVIVHKDNDWVNSITKAQLKEIWKDGSTVKKWKDVNPDWPDLEIKLYGPDAASGTFDYFTEVINGKAKSCRKEFNNSSDDNVLAEGVANDRGSLGYFGYSYYDANKESVKLLAIAGAPAKEEKKGEEKKEDKKPEGGTK